MTKTSIVAGLVAGAAIAHAYAQNTAEIQANPDSSAYLQDSRGVIVRNSDGLCWRTGYWSMNDAVKGCDGPITPPVVSPIAPPLAAVPATVPTPPAAPVPAPLPCDFTVTLQNDASFGFNQARLSSVARQRLDAELVSRLSRCASVTAVQVTGYTDPLGTRQYNEELSTRRAQAVADYLASKGVGAPMTVRGAGESAPVAHCDSKLPHDRLIRCLAPDRRVVVEIKGMQRPVPATQ